MVFASTLQITIWSGPNQVSFPCCCKELCCHCLWLHFVCVRNPGDWIGGIIYKVMKTRLTWMSIYVWDSLGQVLSWWEIQSEDVHIYLYMHSFLMHIYLNTHCKELLLELLWLAFTCCWMQEGQHDWRGLDDIQGNLIWILLTACLNSVCGLAVLSSRWS